MEEGRYFPTQTGMSCSTSSQIHIETGLEFDKRVAMRINSSSDSRVGRTSFLSLPPELREQVYLNLLVMPNIMTMHPGHKYYKNEVYAVQPPITRVNRLIRSECLSLFYSANTVSAQLDRTEDLALAKRWLHAIGDDNVKHLRRVILCGWTKIAFGHMLSNRFVRLEVDLKRGEILGRAGGGWVGGLEDRDGELGKRVERLRAAFRAVLEVQNERSFDADAVAALMEGFARLCNAYV